MLPAYVARLHGWLRPGGRLFILFMQTGKEGGPPFDCPPERMRDLFGSGWLWPDHLADAVPHTLAQGEIPVVLIRV